MKRVRYSIINSSYATMGRICHAAEKYKGTWFNAYFLAGLE